MRERALDPLGREVRERAGEVEEQLRAQRLARPVSVRCTASLRCARSISSPIAPSPSCVRDVGPRSVPRLHRATCAYQRTGGIRPPRASAARPGMLRQPSPTAENGATPIPAAPPPKRHPYDQWSPDARALDLVGDKWTLLIIRDLAAGPRRFVELQRVLPGHLDRAAALAPEPHGRRRPADAPALPRGAAARRLRADRALARADAGARRARAVGLRLDVDAAARRRGRQRRRDLPPRPRAARAAARAERRGRPDRRGRRRRRPSATTS